MKPEGWVRIPQRFSPSAGVPDTRDFRVAGWSGAAPESTENHRTRVELGGMTSYEDMLAPSDDFAVGDSCPCSTHHAINASKK